MTWRIAVLEKVPPFALWGSLCTSLLRGFYPRLERERSEVVEQVASR